MYNKACGVPYHLKNKPTCRNEEWLEIGSMTGRKVVTTAKMAHLLSVLEGRAKAGHYHSHYVHNSVFSLKSTFANSLINTVTTFDQVLPLEGGRVIYQVYGGVIYILDIEVLPVQKKGNDEAGFYNVLYDYTGSLVSTEKVDQIKTTHAVITGLSQDLDHAARMCKDLVHEGYNNGGKAVTEGVSLYYVPSRTLSQAVIGLSGKWRNFTGLAKKTTDALAIAQAMKAAHDNNQEVKWTLHENGTAPFLGALRILKGKQINLNQTQQAYYVNPTSNLIAADLLGRKVGIADGDRGSHITKPLSIRQAYLGGNLVGNIWMQARHAQGNGFDKLSAAGGAALLSGMSLGVYGSIALSAYLMAPVGAAVAPTATKIAGGGMMANALAKSLTALGYVGWASAIVTASSNAAYRRYDRNTGGPLSSLFGQQLGRS